MAAGREMDRTDLLKKGVHLEYFTIGWNVVEALVAIAAGIVAGSIALIGFGLDSIIETVSAGMLLWRLRLELKGQKTDEEHTVAERRALFVVGVTFFLLALYILYESGARLYYREKPDVSIVGFVLSVLSLIAMPTLAVMKFRTSKSLGSRALRADAVETAVCAYLSFTLFLGIGLNMWFGWWWADPVAALLMLPLIVREGWEAIEGSKGNPVYGAQKTGS